MLKNMNLRVKLLLGFVGVAVVGLLIGGVGYFSLASNNKGLQTLYQESIPSIVHLEEVLVRLERIKTAFRTTGIQGISQEDLERQQANILQANDEYQKALQSYESISRTSEEEKLYQVFKGALEKATSLNNKILTLIEKAIKSDEKNREYVVNEIGDFVMSTEFRNNFDGMRADLQSLLEYVKKYYAEEIPQAVIKSAQMAQMSLLVIIVAGFVISIILGVVIGNSVAKNLLKYVDTLTSSSTQLEGASSQIASTSQELSSGASELSSSVEEITSSMEELQSIIEANTKSVNEAEVLMKETLTTAKSSQMEAEELRQMITDVTEISKKVVKINKVIDDIAFQTNILALNVETTRRIHCPAGTFKPTFWL